MSHARLAAALAAALLAAPLAAHAQKRIAVLEFKSSTIQGCGTAAATVASLAARCQLLTSLSDQARSGALAAFKQSGDKSHVVMTREAMAVMLKDMGKGVCVAEGECEVEMGRNIGADLVVSGEVATFGETYLVTLKLHETAKATLLETREVEAVKELEAVRQVRAAATDLVSSGLGLRPQASAGASAGDEGRLAPAALESPATPSPAPRAIVEPAPSHDEPALPPRERPVYVAVRAGAFIPMGKEFAAHPTLGEGGPWKTEFKTGMDLELGAGVRLSPRFRIEAAVGLYRSAAELPESSVFEGGVSYYGTEKLELGVTTYTVTARFAPDAGMPMYILAGGGLYSAKLEDTFTASGGREWKGSYSDSPLGFHFGMGGFYPITRKLRLELEGKFVVANAQLEGVKSDLGGLRIAGGASYRF